MEDVLVRQMFPLGLCGDWKSLGCALVRPLHSLTCPLREKKKRLNLDLHKYIQLQTNRNGDKHASLFICEMEMFVSCGTLDPLHWGVRHALLVAAQQMIRFLHAKHNAFQPICASLRGLIRMHAL